MFKKLNILNYPQYVNKQLHIADTPCETEFIEILLSHNKYISFYKPFHFVDGGLKKQHYSMIYTFHLTNANVRFF